MRLLAATSPGLAARALEKLFLGTRRYPVPERELAWIRDGERAQFESRGRRLSAHVWGAGDAPTVLLAHGWEGRGSQLGAFIAPLRERDFRVVTFDAPGHGSSPGASSSLIEMADAVRDAGRALGPLRGVIAHSGGGGATTLAMANGLEVERAVYIAPPSDLGAFLGQVAGALALPPSVAAETRRRIEKRFEVDWDDLTAEALASRMTARLLVIHDRNDKEVDVEHGETIARLWPGGELRTTEGLGHRRILRDPRVIRTAVEAIAHAG